MAGVLGPLALAAPLAGDCDGDEEDSEPAADEEEYSFF